MPLSSASRHAGPPVYLGAMDDPQMYRLAALPPLEEAAEAELPDAAAQGGAAAGCRRTPPYAPQDAGPPPRPQG